VSSGTIGAVLTPTAYLAGLAAAAELGDLIAEPVAIKQGSARSTGVARDRKARDAAPDSRRPRWRDRPRPVIGDDIRWIGAPCIEVSGGYLI